MISGITRLLTLAALLTVCFGTLTGGVRPDNVAQIRMAGEIVMITRNSPTTYYEDRTGPTGYEYELAKAFADHLGVELKVKVAENLNDVFSTLENDHDQLSIVTRRNGTHAAAVKQPTKQSAL